MVDLADCIEIVGFIGPSELHSGVARFEGIFGFSVGIADGVLLQNEQRGTIIPQQLFNRDTANIGNWIQLGGNAGFTGHT